MSKRASLDELLAFCQRVREAGGGNPLDALMPSVPNLTEQCLIAKNLNFNCQVQVAANRNWDKKYEQGSWVMIVDDRVTRDKIAKELDLTPVDEMRYAYEAGGEYVLREGGFTGVILPKEIGQVAHDFDQVGYFLNDYHFGNFDCQQDVTYCLSDNQITLNDVKEFLPYIESAVEETKNNGGIFNEAGELIL